VNFFRGEAAQRHRKSHGRRKLEVLKVEGREAAAQGIIT